MTDAELSKALEVEAERDQLREALREIIDIIDQGDLSEVWQVALLRGRALIGHDTA